MLKIDLSVDIGMPLGRILRYRHTLFLRLPPLPYLGRFFWAMFFAVIARDSADLA